MLKVKSVFLNLVLNKVLMLVLTTVISGCASLPSLPTNSKIAILRPYEKMVGNKPVLGVYSTASCPKTSDSRIFCVNDVQLPTPEDINKRFGYTGLGFFSKRFQLIQEMRKEQVLDKNGAAIALFADSKQDKQTSFTGFSTEFLGHLMLTAMSVVTKTNAYNTNSGAFVSGATGAFKYTSSGEPAIKTTTNITQKKSYMVWALRIDAKKNKLVNEVIYCPEAVENDKWACLSVVAVALEAATANN
jgi:hypothetical protein